MYSRYVSRPLVSFHFISFHSNPPQRQIHIAAPAREALDSDTPAKVIRVRAAKGQTVPEPREAGDRAAFAELVERRRVRVRVRVDRRERVRPDVRQHVRRDAAAAVADADRDRLRPLARPRQRKVVDHGVVWVGVVVGVLVVRRRKRGRGRSRRGRGRGRGRRRHHP